VIYGTIKDRTDKIKIQISGGSVLVYRTDEIDSIKEESMNKILRKDFFSTYYRKAKGYRNITEVQFTYGPKNEPVYDNFLESDVYPYGDIDDVGVSVHTINGYQVCPQFFIGVGVGMDRLLIYRQTFIPIYMRLQTELLKTRITPYLFGDIGYGFLVADQISNPREDGYSYYKRIGGLYTTLGGGIHIYTKGPISYMIGLGYRRNYSEIKTDDYYGNNDVYKNTYQRLVASWGLTF
jgi:hypothetical protein